MVDENRYEELEQVLDVVGSRILAYAKRADSPDGTVGTYADPTELQHSLHIGVSESGEGIQGLLNTTDLVLNTSVVTWHKAFLEKLYAGTNPVGVASDMLLSILNTNSHVFTASPALTLIEKYVAKKYAGLFGFRGPQAGGLTFPGGSYSNITAIHMARSLKFPETKEHGNGNLKLALFTSKDSHYSIEKAAILSGLGSKSVFKVAVNSDGSMNIEALETAIVQAKSQGYTPFLVNGTAGSTVFGSFDNFEEIARVAKEHSLWFHIDGSWGGNFIFSKTQSKKLQGSNLSNSITVNPHKMLGVPCTCSFLLVPNEKLFQEANSLSAPYLFHNGDDSEDNFDLADGTMGCGRRPDALKFYLGWQWYGTNGYGERIDHAYAVTEYLVSKVSKAKNFKLISPNPSPCLQTCFYYSPDGRFDLEEENTAVTRYIARELFSRSQFLVDYSLSPSHGEFFRVVINAPSVDEKLVDSLLEEIINIGRDYKSTNANNVTTNGTVNVSAHRPDHARAIHSTV